MCTFQNKLSSRRVGWFSVSFMGVCALVQAGDGDAGGFGVAVQVVQGGEAGRAGGEGDVVLREQVAGVLDGGADGVGGDAEQAGQDVQRQAEAGAHEGGGELGGGGGVRGGGGGPAAGGGRGAGGGGAPGGGAGGVPPRGPGGAA